MGTGSLWILSSSILFGRQHRHGDDRDFFLRGYQSRFGFDDSREFHYDGSTYGRLMLLLELLVPATLDKGAQQRRRDAPKGTAKKGYTGPEPLGTPVANTIVVEQISIIEHREWSAVPFSAIPGYGDVDAETDRKKSAQNSHGRRGVKKAVGLAATPKNLEHDHSSKADDPGDPPEP